MVLILEHVRAARCSSSQQHEEVAGAGRAQISRQNAFPGTGACCGLTLGHARNLNLVANCIPLLAGRPVRLLPALGAGLAVPQAQPAQGAAGVRCRHHVPAGGAVQPLPGAVKALSSWLVWGWRHLAQCRHSCACRGCSPATSNRCAVGGPELATLLTCPNRRRACWRVVKAMLGLVPWELQRAAEAHLYSSTRGC